MTAGATGEINNNPRYYQRIMAKRKYSDKKRNIEPAVQTVTVVTPVTTGNTTGQYTLDLSQIASLINRRFYRQGINWAVAGFKIFTLTSGSIRIHKLQNTWVTSNAWEKAFRKWNKQQMDAVEDMGAESAVAAFRDFKIHMDDVHVTDGFASNLLPIDAFGIPIQTGEWQPSQVVIPNDGAPGVTNEYFVQMNGASSAAAKSIIGGYAFSRSYPQSPDPVSPAVETSWLNRMFDVGDENDDVLDNATDRNDQLPYNQTAYPGSSTNFAGLQIHDQASITATTIGGTTRLKGGNFPCGLVRFQHDPAESANLVIQIDLIPGSHRGYLCESMTEM